MKPDEIDALVDKLTIYNQAYRDGNPLVSDAAYDRLVEQLREVAPRHSYLKEVEPEFFTTKQKIKHPSPMLSIQKAYHLKSLEQFVQRIEKTAAAIGEPAVVYRVTAKLDGVAGRFDGKHLVSRGDGLYGFDISSAFKKGVVAVNGPKTGLGEIVMKASYFDAHLADDFEHPRNLVVGIIGSDKVNEKAIQALADGMIHFIRYKDLPGWHGDGRQLLDNIENVYLEMVEDIDYPVDGIVIQVSQKNLKEVLGATTHHYRWQIAYKKKGEIGQSTISCITWQVGRTGNITPVLEVEPVRISGATIRRVTAHHAGMIRKMGIGIDARIEIIRSGEVIPKLESVLAQGEQVIIPANCPSCGNGLVWRGDFLRCTNHGGCRDQIVGRLHHWFHILGSADWFGIKTIEKLVDRGFDRLEKVYNLSVDNLIAVGFGPVQSKNLYEAYQLSLTQPVEDWRLLAAIGIPGLGIGESRKILRHFTFERLWECGWKQLEALKGFGEIKARTIVSGLGEFFDTYCHVIGMNFQLIRTSIVSAASVLSTPLTGKGVVFTGKMTRGSRENMQAVARQLGAKAQTSVTKATDYLVCGRKAGAKKIEKAHLQGTTVITEDEFFELIEGFVQEER